MSKPYPNHGNYGEDIFIDAADMDGKEIFIDEADIIAEYDIDEEELPDAESEGDYDGEDGIEDSMHIFDHTDEVLTAACSPTDATLLAIGCKDNKGFLWKIGDWAFELDGHEESVSSLSFSADGRLLASGSLDGVVKIWYIAEEDSKCTFKCSLKCTSDWLPDIWMRWHPNEHLILVGGFEDCSVWMWNADEAACVNVFKGHREIVTCGDFTPNVRYICTGSKDATMRIIGENSHVVVGHSCHTKGLTCLAITSDSSLALTGSEDGFVQLVNISTGKVVDSSSQHSKSVECVAFKPSSRRDSWIAATAGMDGKLKIWDSRQPYHRLPCNCEAGVTCLVWLADSRHVATGGVDGKVRIWDSLSGNCAKIFSGHSDNIQYISISSNGDYLVSVSYDKTARVFDIAEFNS